MRECIRCGTEMRENCGIKVEGAGYGIVLSADEAICPKCGEVSIYLEDLDRLK